ncbi:MAG: hypothetical protein HC899_20190 [Leptolyngbyaceae cyanobacterium SM1_4_3]|nr:hypothetical protein [Leptolyngbyaceae cyanobacterium SM1_4_3]
MVFAQAIERDGNRDARLIIKSILIIEEFTVKNYPRKFDLEEVFLHMHGAADSYTIMLRFYGGFNGIQDAVTLSKDISLAQEEKVNSKHNYRLKLIIYLSSRLRWDKPDASGYYYIARNILFKHLGLFGKNIPRQNQTLWQAIDQLIGEGLIESAHTIEGNRRASKIAIKLNPQKICLMDSSL